MGKPKKAATAHDDHNDHSLHQHVPVESLAIGTAGTEMLMEKVMEDVRSIEINKKLPKFTVGVTFSNTIDTAIYQRLISDNRKDDNISFKMDTEEPCQSVPDAHF